MKDMSMMEHHQSFYNPKKVHMVKVDMDSKGESDQQSLELVDIE
jgi:hypothetical protein